MNIHIITGPNGMCRCGEDGKTCSEILNHETARLTSELIALQAHVEELRAFAKEVGEFIANTYDNADWFNKAKKHLASQPDLTLIEEVRDADGVRTFLNKTLYALGVESEIDPEARLIDLANEVHDRTRGSVEAWKGQESIRNDDLKTELLWLCDKMEDGISGPEETKRARQLLTRLNPRK